MMRLGFASDDRLLPALLLAAAIHAGMGYGLRFDIPSPPAAIGPLDVVLLPSRLEGASTVPGAPVDATTRSEPKPTDGGALGDAASRPPESSTAVPPTSAAASSETPGTAPPAPFPGPEAAHREDSRNAQPGSSDRPDSAAVESVEDSPIDTTEPIRLTADTLDQQISEWTAGYTQAQQAESRRPSRTAYIEDVASHRYLASAYERAWQDKVERVGNLNYPEEARRKSLTGGLLMSVAVNADGTVQSIKIRQSSGHAELDQAAERIVRLAAPFAVFPSELKKDYDVLLITRTWRFLIDNRLSTTP